MSTTYLRLSGSSELSASLRACGIVKGLSQTLAVQLRGSMGVLPDVAVLSMTLPGNEPFAAPGESETVDDSDPLELCNAFVAALPITGASIAVLASSGARLTLCSSDATAARVDELQFELGEGPQFSVSRFGNFIGIPDVAQHLHHEWPVFGAALHELSIGALFSVPMRMGAVTLGVATLYCTVPRVLSPEQKSTALAIASAGVGSLTSQALRSATDEIDAESQMAPASRREIHQATGMVLVQLDTTATIAFARLQAHAFANMKTLQQVAHEVVSGVFTFDATPYEAEI